MFIILLCSLGATSIGKSTRGFYTCSNNEIHKSNTSNDIVVVDNNTDENQNDSFNCGGTPSTSSSEEANGESSP